MQCSWPVQLYALPDLDWPCALAWPYLDWPRIHCIRLVQWAATCSLCSRSSVLHECSQHWIQPKHCTRKPQSGSGTWGWTGCAHAAYNTEAGIGCSTRQALHNGSGVWSRSSTQTGSVSLIWSAGLDEFDTPMWSVW